MASCALRVFLRIGAATPVLGDLCHCLTTLMVKNFFLTSNINIISVSLKAFLFVLSLQALVKQPCPYFL